MTVVVRRHQQVLHGLAVHEAAAGGGGGGGREAGQVVPVARRVRLVDVLQALVQKVLGREGGKIIITFLHLLLHIYTMFIVVETR